MKTIYKPVLVEAVNSIIDAAANDNKEIVKILATASEFSQLVRELELSQPSTSAKGWFVYRGVRIEREQNT